MDVFALLEKPLHPDQLSGASINQLIARTKADLLYIAVNLRLRTQSEPGAIKGLP